MRTTVLTREALTTEEQAHYRRLGRLTCPWWLRWMLWLDGGAEP